ncbi:hypothetical protein K4K49_005862 [Colletotrichum sp. SAR 10_70]|uniref:uncharacterized protein n=1 Tax=Colletotrichum siamense TaxID=690259 RepID=UPI0018724F49|nr:uncharacterized protein CGCS363_v003985 [Colletotrichum siamense]KAI8156681.1 hypothetical protein K4K50_005410 [Colletotrichum sp. SAR 10_71]KAI8165031.1 hypothetical protein K4K49_005862 [Colletotrichum sp. SAR 10_70]KAI8187828.1 hypothetical protein K4K51_007976 [Colletotrichum sp. SAR 10_75]KAI8199048.1 hypothetical protein K4K52_009211 [Colletotrichum sp. SAR 10_76]KAI8216125.1 hypothetical protein K4K53_010413 [Colletotrichum sp. SAR 10_77]KAI8271116.1 hypothetical protein K4K56_0035
MALDGVAILLLTMYIVMTVAFIGLFAFMLLRIKAERAEFDRRLQQIVSDNDLVEVSESVYRQGQATEAAPSQAERQA